MHPAGQPSLVFADKEGNITDFPDLHAAGMSAGNVILPAKEDYIPLPDGSELFVLPGRFPVGCDRKTGEALLVDEDPYGSGETIQAVAAFMSPAHTAVLNSRITSYNVCYTKLLRRLSPEVFTVGFARRFSTYKRADLIFDNIDTLCGIATENRWPINFLFSGKAHPADEPGKSVIKLILDYQKELYEKSNGLINLSYNFV